MSSLWCVYTGNFSESLKNCFEDFLFGLSLHRTNIKSYLLMKKNLLLILLILGAWNFSAFGITSTNTTTVDDKEVIFEKVITQKVPRAPGVSSPVVTANINSSYLTLNVSNFTGNVLVEIIGENGYTSSFYCDGAAMEVLPLDQLTLGIEYTIRITLEYKGMYTGTFTL